MSKTSKPAYDVSDAEKRDLELITAEHSYQQPARHTMRLVPVNVG